MSNLPRTIVFGAGGNVGQHIIPALLKAGVPTTVATRSSSKATFSDQVSVVIADYDDLESLTSAIRGHDVVVALVPERAATAQKLLPDAAVAAGATYFLPSEYGHDANNEGVTSLLPIFTEKRAVKAHLKKKEKDGLSWTGLTTALFFDWVCGLSLFRILQLIHITLRPVLIVTQGFGWNSFDVDLQKATATIWDGGDTRFSAANMDDIANTVVTLITDESVRKQYLNQDAYISSVQTTQNELLAAAEEVTGQKFDVQQRSSNEAFNDPSNVMDVLKAIQLSDRGLSDYAKRVEAGHGKFVVDRKRDVREVLKEILNKA